MRQLLCTILFFSSSIILGQDLKKGLILPSEEFEECCIYIPETGLNIYKTPKTTSIGKLKLGTPENPKDAYNATIYKADEKIKVDFSSLHMVGYEVFALKYKDKKDQFVKLETGYWVDIAELNSKGLELNSWMDYLIAKENIMGWYANGPGLNLRDKPNSNADIIVTFKGDLWEITPTIEFDGLWCKVKVKEYKEHPCSGDDDLILRELIGWVKLLSDDQTPNVWNYGKGC